MKQMLVSIIILLVVKVLQAQDSKDIYHEKHRPQIHFSPKKGWMNDPNGLVYAYGTYHLFYQYYPDDIIWGPMHWGHATSSNLIDWKEQPIALYPDSLGYIFSGSAVVDVNNTSGLGKNGVAPLVAIFTHHNPIGEKAGKTDFQYQSIAYSLDSGNTWTKYNGNPVLKNPGITDFRDPKVFWHATAQQWIMTLAVKDHIEIYASKNLLSWQKQSEFGHTQGYHGGVWECPDLFSMEYKGKKIWVLLVNINPGGPNGGSANQYFVGNFDGKTFVPIEKNSKWIDFGRDNYAGVTWSNTGKRKLFIGWMNNWQYAQQVPTKNWRSATTIVRELGVECINNHYYVTAKPAQEIANIITTERKNIELQSKIQLPAMLSFSAKNMSDFTLLFHNTVGDTLTLSYMSHSKKFLLNRKNAGDTSFSPSFASTSWAPRISSKETIDCTLIIDVASIEVFADGGLTVLTETFFPKEPYNSFSFDVKNKMHINNIVYKKLKTIW